jgi:hypothetical protein
MEDRWFEVHERFIMVRKLLLCQSCGLKKRDREFDVKFRKNCKACRMESYRLCKFKMGVRNLINSSLKRKGYTKKSRTQEILGCSFEEFKIHLESKFEPWMNWENRGKIGNELNIGWDLDHIIPLSSVKTEEEILKLNNYTNFQPLCSYTNRYIKRSKLDFTIESVKKEP